MNSPLSATTPPEIVPAPRKIEPLATPIVEDRSKPGRFLRQDNSGTLFFSEKGMALSLPGSAETPDWGIHWKIQGARDVSPLPQKPLPGKVHHLVGSTKSDWTTNQNSYQSVRYREILPQIDLEFVSRPKGVEYILHAAPGWNPKPIQIEMDGVEKMTLGKDGKSLEMKTGVGLVRERGLYCYQPLPGGRHRVIEARYESVQKESDPLAWSFSLTVNEDQIDPTLPLVIDPTLSWSAMVGGTAVTGVERGSDVAVDNAGMLYTIGTTSSPSFPTLSGFEMNYQGSTDAYVMKIDPSGPSIVWATYLGGSSSDYGCGIDVDAAGNVYVTGDTSSNDFPNLNAFQPFPGGLPDAFVAKIGSAGWDLFWSSYLGGGYLGSAGNPESDHGRDLVLGPSGDIYVTGYTNSPLFPVSGAFQSAMGGYFPWGTSDYDAFVARIADGSMPTVVWASYLGGSEEDRAFGIDVDGDGNAVVTGITTSNDFPLASAAQTSFGNGFVTKVNAAGDVLDWSTYWGTVSNDHGYGVAIDGSGNVYVTGKTYSSSFPVTPGAYQTTLGGGSDAFVSKFSALGTVLWSTYLGGSIGASTDLEAGVDIVVDASGSVTVAGYTDEINFPTNGGFQSIFGGGPTDAFVSRFLPDGSALEWSSLLGGDGADQATGVVRDNTGITYLAGFTGSSNFPVTAGGWAPSFSQDGFLVQVSGADTIPPLPPTSGWVSPNPGNDPTPLVQWSGATDSGGSGIASYDIRLSDDSGASWAIVGTFLPATSWTQTPALSDGTYLYQVRTRDGAGNVGIWSVSSAPAVIDTVAPNTAITSAPANPTTSTSATFDFKSNESSSTYERRLDGGAWQAVTAPETIAGLAEGNHTYDVRAIDPAGNIDPSAASYPWTIDSGDPETSIVFAPPTTSVSSDATFMFTSSQSGSSFEHQLDGGGWQTATTPDIYTGISDGSHAYEVRAIGPTGNIDSTPAKHIWTIDTNAPETVITSAPSNPSGLWNPAFDFKSNESGCTFERRIDGSAWETVTSIDTVTGLTNGSHTYEIRAIDAAGNIDPTPASHTWVIDTLLPETTLVSSPPNPSNDLTPTFTFSSSEAGSSFKRRYDGNTWKPILSPDTLPFLSNGSHTYEVRAIDLAGNIDPTPATYTWTIDTIGPDTSITVTPPNLSSSDSATFLFTSTETGSTFERKLDGGAWQTTTSPETLSGLSEGSHTYKVRAFDSIGNIDPTPASYTWSIDTVTPNTTITSTPGNPSGSSNATFTFSSSENPSSFQRRLDSGAWQGVASPEVLTGLVDGNHTYEVRAIDPTGNTDPTPASYSWLIDSAAPGTPVLLSPLDGALVGANTILQWSGDGDSYEVDFDGTPVSVSGTTFALSSSPEGNHTWRVRAIDLAGNVSGWSPLWSFTLDNIPPGQVQLLTPANGSLLSTGGVAFSWEEVFDSNNIAYYVLQLDENPTFPNPVFLEATSANLFLPIPPPGSAPLYWRVRAVDIPGNSGAWSQTWSYSGTNSLDTPTLLLPMNGSLLPEEGFLLDWSDVPDAAGYEIEIDSGFTGSPVLSQQESPLLSPGTYSWHVRATGTGSTGPWSSWNSFTIDPASVSDTTGPFSPIPFSPANGTIDIIDPVVELKWFAGNDPESGISHHRVELFDSTGALLLHEEVVEETYLVLPPLEAGTYSWTVTAINGAGAVSIPSATWTFAVEPALDITPPGETILFSPPNESVIESDVIAFLWNEAPDDVRVVGYEIEINKQPTFENPVAWKIHTNKPKVTIRLPPRLHYWRVRPIDGGGNKGPWSETWSFEVRNPPVSTGPADEGPHGSKEGSCFGSIPSRISFPVGLASILLGLLLFARRSREKYSG